MARMTLDELVHSGILPLLLSTLSLLFVSIAYLPIKSNAVMTVSLSELNFTNIYYKYRTTVEKVTEYIPEWKNQTAKAWKDVPTGRHEYCSGPDFYRCSVRYEYTRYVMDYEYKEYGYTLNTTEILGPELPKTINLNDTNFCDEYSFGPWGFFADSKTNGVSHSVLKPNLGRYTNVQHYRQPYALKNHSGYETVANIWDIVRYGGPGYYSWNHEKGDDLLADLRLAIVFSSIPFLLNLFLYVLAPTRRNDDEDHMLWEVILFGFVVIASLALTAAGLAKISISLIDLKQLQDGFERNSETPYFWSTRIPVSLKLSHQMRGFLATAAAFSAAHILATAICGFLTTRSLLDDVY